jgi:iron(III) transport system permease protein
LAATLGLSWLLAFLSADERTRPLLWNTLLLAGGSAALSLPPGAALALLIYRTNLPGRRWLRSLLILMLFVPPYLQVAGWEAGFGLQGWFCRMVYPDQAMAVLAGWRGAIWTQSLVNVPWIVLLLGAALANIPAELELQASMYGSAWRVLQWVTLPLLRGALVASALGVFVLAANDVSIADVYQIHTFAEEIYTGFALGDTLSDVPLRTLPGMFLIAGLAIAALLACSHVSQFRLAEGSCQSWQLDVRPFAAVLWLVLGGWMALLVCVPISSLVYQAGLQIVAEGEARIRTWSLAKAVTMVATSPARFSQEYAWSFALAQLTSVGVLATSVVLAWRSRTSTTTRVLSWVLMLTGLVLPGPLLALLLGRLLNQPSWEVLHYAYDRTLLLPWLTLSVRLLPFGYLIAELVMRRVPQNSLDLAAVEGAMRWQILRYAVWPHVASSLGWLWLILLALTVADLSVSILAVPPGVTTIAIRIFNLVHYGVTDQLAALCLGTMILFGALAGLVASLWPAGFGSRRHTV